MHQVSKWGKKEKAQPLLFQEVLVYLAWNSNFKKQTNELCIASERSPVPVDWRKDLHSQLPGDGYGKVPCTVAFSQPIHFCTGFVPFLRTQKLFSTEHAGFGAKDISNYLPYLL